MMTNRWPSRPSRYQCLLEQCAAGEPLAYLTGEREFWSLALTVTPAVLIPRPETELAVERCLALHDASPAAILDLGTGSGAIALALAVERPRWRIMATDFDAGALQVARGNAAQLGLQNVYFEHGDWFEPLRGRQFDLIISNPPYVAAGDPALQALRYEPAAALTPGSDGMEALRRIVLQAPAHLLPGGWLVLEHGAGQAAAVAGSLVEAGYARVRCYVDLQAATASPRRSGPETRCRKVASTRNTPMVRFETSHGGFTVELYQETHHRRLRISCAMSTTASSTAPYSIASYPASSSRAAA